MSEVASPATTLSVGSAVGNYRVEGKIGEGGMGAVYLATHPLLGRKAAIKVLLPEHSSRPDLVTRFFNEAKTTASLHHPALVEVFDFGFLPDGAGYIVMDFLEGESLAARLVRVSRLPADAAADIARQIAAGVAAAHGQGIIHRDLKPDNVFLVPDPEQPGRERVKILDFGIAKLVLPSTSLSQGARDVRTSTGMLLGTPLFMAPEQCRGTGQVDHRADIYSVGCILFNMLTGRPPFNHEGVGEVLAAHLHEPVASPRSLEPSVPPVLEAIVLRALDKNPDARFQTMAELGTVLQQFLTPPAPAPVASPRRPPTRPGLVVLGGFALVAAAAVVGVYLSIQPPQVPSAPAAATPPPAAGPSLPAAPPAPAPVPVPPVPTTSPPVNAAESAPDPTAVSEQVKKEVREEEVPPPAAAAPSAEEEPPPPSEPTPELDPPPGKPAATRTRAARQARPSGNAATASYRRALDHRARGEEAEALLAFRAALASGGLAPEDKVDAERQSILLRPKFGEVEVLCDLRDALVTIDGRPEGRTPLARPILLRPGRHVLVMSRPGYRTVTRSIDVPAGGRLPMRFSLPK